MDDAVEMNDAQRGEAKEYGRRELYCGLADRGLDILYLAAFSTWAARPLAAWLRDESGLRQLWIQLVGMFLIMTLGHMAVSFPLSFYAGHVLEHRYGLSRQSFSRWLIRYAKRNGLTLAFGLLLTQGLYWTIWLTGSYWWLVAAAASFVVSAILGQLAPVLIMPLFYKFERLPDDELLRRLSKLADGTGLNVEGVYRMEMSAETAKANAMLAGLGSTRRVILGDTLLDNFSGDEIEVIFAHEVGHHVHRHIHKLIGSILLFSGGSFFVCDRVLRWHSTGQLSGALDYGSLPVWTLPWLTLVITLMSLLFEPLQNAVSRRFEVQADTYALQRTRHKSAFQSAFHKLAKINKADPDPHPLEVLLFHSHPPIKERLALANKVS